MPITAVASLYLRHYTALDWASFDTVKELEAYFLGLDNILWNYLELSNGTVNNLVPFQPTTNESTPSSSADPLPEAEDRTFQDESSYGTQSLSEGMEQEPSGMTFAGGVEKSKQTHLLYSIGMA
ncbi:hypothetical protein MRX96_058727 [Rhipicephalus microplus]